MKKNKLTPGSNLLWESSRMIIPEHREEILRFQKKANKKQRPILAEHKLEELSYLMSEALHDNQEVTLTVFNPYMDTVITGIIKKIDFSMKRIKILSENDETWIRFIDLLDIEKRCSS